ncbi:hypothetical protein DL98DRAFT_287586 [Cadophora sp. DSE1049]|nr:hypothetical protein DL98DRAFT_287586 [Cadophora sp. DSE1049]
MVRLFFVVPAVPAPTRSTTSLVRSFVSRVVSRCVFVLIIVPRNGITDHASHLMSSSFHPVILRLISAYSTIIHWILPHSSPILNLSYPNLDIMISFLEHKDLFQFLKIVLSGHEPRPREVECRARQFLHPVKKCFVPAPENSGSDSGWCHIEQ